jgi:prophage antirepressor-like protein
MNELLKVFNFKSNEVRIVIKDEEPWFVAKDVCNILEINNSRDALSRLDKDEKDVVLTDTLGGKQELQSINEMGLYSLVLSSRKPEAKDFKRWITHEVIPAIRKHGGYLTPEKVEEALLNPDVLIRLATNLKEEREKRLIAEAKVESLTSGILSWNPRKAINRMIRLIATKVFDNFYPDAWGKLEAELLYKHGINIKSRKTFSKLKDPTLFDVLKDEEMKLCVQSSVALCEMYKINIDNLLIEN